MTYYCYFYLISSSCCSSSLLHLSWDSSRLQVEENQPSPHLTHGLSPGLKLLSGLRGQQLLAYFHKYIAMVDDTHTSLTCKFMFKSKIKFSKEKYGCFRFKFP